MATFSESSATSVASIVPSRGLMVCLAIFLLCLSTAARAQEMGARPYGYEVQTILAGLSVNPRDVALLNSYGIEQAKAGDLIGAVRTWRYALDIDRRYVHLYNNIGSALRRLGQLQASYEWYRASLVLSPTYWTWFNLGLLLEDMGRFPEAVQAHQAALAMYPGFSQARERVLYLERTRDRRPGEQEPGSKTEMGERHPKPETELPKPPKRPNLPKPPKVPKLEYKPQPVIAQSTPAVVKSEGGQSVGLVLPNDQGGQVFLTFDGGADADGLEGILQALGRFQVNSTFFLTGKFVKAYPDLARRILAEGHEIANHSMNHPNMSSWSKERIADELARTEQVFQEVLGRRAVPFFRFPFGAQNRRVEAIVESLGYHPVYWHIDTLDWKEPSVSSILEKVRRRIGRGNVVLMHVGSRNGSKALPTMLEELLGRGFRPTRLTALDASQIAALP